MVFIDRHSGIREVDGDYLEWLDELVSDDLPDLRTSARRTLGMAKNTSLTRCLARSVVDPRASKFESWDAWVTATQMGTALFDVARVSEGEVVCRIAHEDRTIPATGPQHYNHVGNWLDAFWLSLVTRDLKRMTRLAEFPLDAMRQEGEGIEVDAFQYSWVDTLQTWWAERHGLVEKLTATLEESHPDRAVIAGAEMVDRILYPPIRLFYCYLRQDREQFQEALVEALEFHKQYWTADEDRVQQLDGTVALGPLAMACLAFDAGWDIGVESEYLPHFLLNRTWVGEFDT
ncbi:MULTISPECIES: immunity 49 family protein [Streptomyces]|uniref:immunity 49 family protein n=1 Tax=Streptomyces TaxID=1883 RepID=UPI001F2A6E81|nr:MULTISPECIES: immunity 49 family protein [unclassified Streptomyces]